MLVASALLAGVPVGIAAAATPLSKLVLGGAQVGTGYTLELRPDSHGVGNTVTLDLCGTVFRSEALRTARLQVDYTRKGSPLGVSNEVVTYRNGGAQLAMQEIRQSVAHCPRTPVASGSPASGSSPTGSRTSRSRVDCSRAQSPS